MAESTFNSELRRVVFLNTTLAQGGTERNLVQYALRLKQHGLDIEVWYLYRNENDYSALLADGGVGLRCFDVKGRKDVSSYFRVARALSQTNADLLHIYLPTTGYYYLLSRFLCRLRIPTVYSCGGTEFLLPFERSMTKRLAKSCYPMIGNSPAVTKFLENGGVPRDRLRVIPNGHDLEAYSGPLDRAGFRATHGLPVDKKLLMSVGRLIPGKRHHDILRAYSSLRKSRQDIELVLVGDGQERENLVTLAGELNVGDSVHFLGARKDVSDCLRAADMFVFASESEGLPNALIEASLAGLPIVATDIKPNLSVVEHKTSALIVPVRSPEKIALAISNLLDNQTLSESLPKVAQANAQQRFCISRSIESLLAAYQDSLKRYATTS